MPVLNLVAAGLLMILSFASFAFAEHAPASSGENAEVAANPEALADGRADAGKTLFRRLSNGLALLVLPDSRFPLVSMRLYVHAGSAYERPEEAGISHMLEHMVFKGTESRPRGQVARDVEKLGGYLNAATSFDYTVYLTDMIREHWKTGLDVLKDMAFSPSLDPDELEAEKDVVVAELKRGEDNPGQRLFRMTQQIALAGTPYFNPIIGYERTIRALSAEDIRAYIERLYQPQSMLLVICGDVEAGEAALEAERLFGALQNREGANPPLPLDEKAKARAFGVTLEEGPWNKVHLALALPVPGMGDLRSARLDVLAHVLGGDASSRLPRVLKYEKRLVDGISASNYNFERLGMFYINATLDADKLEPFWKELCKELANAAKGGFGNEELERARFNIEDGLYRSKETLSGHASKLGYFSFFDRGAQGEANYLQAVRESDSRMLTDLARSFLRPEALSLAVLLPARTKAPAGAKEAGEGPEVWKTWFADTLRAGWKGAAAGDGKAGRAASEKAGETEIVNLGKGRTLVLVPDPTLPYVSVNMLFSGGDALLEEKDQGLAAFAASLLTRGTKRLGAMEVEDFLADRAASFSASSGRGSFFLSLDAPARFLDDMLGLLKETLTTPAMKEEEAARVRQNQIAGITMREDQPIGLAFRRMFPFFFKAHPYGFLQQGEKERVGAFRAADAREFWRKQNLRPWTLSVCGIFDREAVLAAARKLPVPAAGEVAVDPPVWGADKELLLNLPGRNQGHLFMAFPTVGQGDADEAGLELLQNVLAGQSGLLFRDLRDDQGLGYTVTAMTWKAARAGAMVFYIGTGPDKMDVAEEGFRRIIAKLAAENLPEEELERGRNGMLGDYYRDHQTLGARSAESALLVSQRRPLDAVRTMIDRAAALTADDVRELARKYLRPDAAYIVKVLP
ncbi:MAG: insulinase family protein [Desulfovibrio sp.]|jgi:zinc protease|nr:insulinase family protein [Desulfovibrio sp.]